MIVRQLRPEDMNGTITIMGYYRDEMQIPDELWNDEAVVQSIKFYASNMQCRVFLALEGYRIVGILLGNLKKEFYNNNYSAAIQMFYLMPGFKNDDNYLQMYNEFDKWTKTVNSTSTILMDISDNTASLTNVKELLEFDTRPFKLFIKD